MCLNLEPEGKESYTQCEKRYTPKYSEINRFDNGLISSNLHNKILQITTK